MSNAGDLHKREKQLPRFILVNENKKVVSFFFFNYYLSGALCAFFLSPVLTLLLTAARSVAVSKQNGFQVFLFVHMLSLNGCILRRGRNRGAQRPFLCGRRAAWAGVCDLLNRRVSGPFLYRKRTTDAERAHSRISVISFLLSLTSGRAQYLRIQILVVF